MVGGLAIFRFVYIWLFILQSFVNARYKMIYSKHRYSINMFERTAKLYLDLVEKAVIAEEQVRQLRTKIEFLEDTNNNDTFSAQEYQDLVHRWRREKASLFAYQWKLDEMKVSMKDIFDHTLSILLDYYYSLHSSLSGKRILCGGKHHLLQRSKINASLAYFEQIIDLIQELMVYQLATSSSEEYSASSSKITFRVFS